MSSPLNFHLEHYEGPLDLLLDLIRKQQINIYDIPIAQITAQYLEYMQQAAKMDVELSAEFIYMAATLIQIKSKMLLPRDPALHQTILKKIRARNWSTGCWSMSVSRAAAEMLHQKRVVEEAVWSNPQIEQFPREDDGTPGLAVTLHDLVKTFQGVLERAKNRPVYEIANEDVSVPDMIRYVRTSSRTTATRSVSARDLFEGSAAAAR